MDNFCYNWTGFDEERLTVDHEGTKAKEQAYGKQRSGRSDENIHVHEIPVLVARIFLHNLFNEFTANETLRQDGLSCGDLGKTSETFSLACYLRNSKAEVIVLSQAIC